MPPTIKGEHEKEDLQQRIREQLRAVENDKIKNVRGKCDRPAEKRPLGGQPDSQHRRDETGNLRPVLSEVACDRSPAHLLAALWSRPCPATQRRSSSNSLRPASL